MFREAAIYDSCTKLKENAVSVTGYISNCINYVSASKTIMLHPKLKTMTTFPNQKSWMNAEVCASEVPAFRSGDKLH